MPPDDQTRKLATIVALDVAGYSARTEADEAKSTAEVAGLRAIIETNRQDPRGPRVQHGRRRLHARVRLSQPNGDLLGHEVNGLASYLEDFNPGEFQLR